MQLKHIEHPEDLILTESYEGFAKVKQIYDDAYGRLLNESRNGISFTMKMDGSPSIVFGDHPETGQFFVGTKSVFNKKPKINYNFSDIRKNHGNNSELVEKLCQCLTHLPKITPPGAIFQGDLMFTEDSLDVVGNEHRFTPNCITYSLKECYELYNELAHYAKLGIYVHTEYDKKFQVLFKRTNSILENEDVMTRFGEIISVYNSQNTCRAFRILNTAETYFKLNVDVDKLGMHEDLLRIYINKCIFSKETPNAIQYIDFLMQRTRESNAKIYSLRSHAKEYQNDIDGLLLVHRLLQDVKHVFLEQLCAHSTMDYFINGKQTKPEGVVIRDNNTESFYKLTNRHEFNASNYRLHNG